MSSRAKLPTICMQVSALLAAAVQKLVASIHLCSVVLSCMARASHETGQHAACMQAEAILASCTSHMLPLCIAGRAERS